VEYHDAPNLLCDARKTTGVRQSTDDDGALTGGIVSILAYGIVIWAMQYDAMGVVSALRETSVVYAAIIGRFFLKEKLSARRITSCLAIAMGAACLAY
jgi:drug/metabolite transporter (DMT)-like permease